MAFVSAPTSFAAPPPTPGVERWVTAHMDTALYTAAEPNGEVLGLAPAWTSYRVDGPSEAQSERFWVWNPYIGGHGWIPATAIGPGRAPTEDEVLSFWAAAAAQDVAELRDRNPREYLYARYPELAPLLDCIARAESGWANVPNSRGSGAFGPFQFMQGTFYSTPTGRGGGNWLNPADQVDAAVDMVRAGRVREWAVITHGLC